MYWTEAMALVMATAGVAFFLMLLAATADSPKSQGVLLGGTFGFLGVLASLLFWSRSKPDERTRAALISWAVVWAIIVVLVPVVAVIAAVSQ